MTAAASEQKPTIIFWNRAVSRLELTQLLLGGRLWSGQGVPASLRCAPESSVWRSKKTSAWSSRLTIQPRLQATGVCLDLPLIILRACQLQRLLADDWPGLTCTGWERYHQNCRPRFHAFTVPSEPPAAPRPLELRVASMVPVSLNSFQRFFLLLQPSNSRSSSRLTSSGTAAERRTWKGKNDNRIREPSATGRGSVIAWSADC